MNRARLIYQTFRKNSSNYFSGSYCVSETSRNRRSCNRVAHSDRKGGILKKEITMATNPPGKGTKTICVNLPDRTANELEKRADSMHISKSKYCKIVLRQWLDSGKKLSLGEK
jgi:hypothetical protein